MDQVSSIRVRRLRRDMRPAAFAMVTWWVVLLSVPLCVFVEDEIVLLTAVFVVLLGAGGLASAIGTRNNAAIGLAVLSLSAVFAFALIISLAGFDPPESTPVLLMAMVFYVVGTAQWVWRLWRTRGSAFSPWQCQSCGYALIGLRGSACPECGAAFDPDRVHSLTPPALRLS